MNNTVKTGDTIRLTGSYSDADPAGYHGDTVVEYLPGDTLTVDSVRDNLVLAHGVADYDGDQIDLLPVWLAHYEYEIIMDAPAPSPEHPWDGKPYQPGHRVLVSLHASGEWLPATVDTAAAFAVIPDYLDWDTIVPVTLDSDNPDRSVSRLCLVHRSRIAVENLSVDEYAEGDTVVVLDASLCHPAVRAGMTGVVTSVRNGAVTVDVTDGPMRLMRQMLYPIQVAKIGAPANVDA